jgi:hypothetical protein
MISKTKYKDCFANLKFVRYIGHNIEWGVGPSGFTLTQIEVSGMIGLYSRRRIRKLHGEFFFFFHSDRSG